MTEEIIIWITKFVHLATISVWAGGLICLPSLIAMNKPKEDVALHKTVRFLYVYLVSPAAFLAVASGTLLIFLQATYNEWFSMKMAFVGVMVLLHVFTGLRLVASFSKGKLFPKIPSIILTIFLSIVIIIILWIVLVKPPYDLTNFFEIYFTPGSLGERYPFLKFWENEWFWGAVK